MMDFEAQDGSEFEDANLIQPGGNAAPPAVARSGATQVLTANAQGVVVLPEGVSLEDIQIEGRNLVVIGDDGTRYVIIDGAIVVPQLVVEGVAVPPANLAALLLGNEPEPAAGNPQSSGGNFAGAVGDIQAAFDLGNLLPYTELGLPADEEREIIPDVVDRDPGTVIVTPNNPAGAVMATASVNEAGLPARGSEPAGSNAASNSETTTGTIIYTAPDGLDTISINGVVITTPNQTVAGSFGTLTVTSVAPGAIGYTYTLADNTLTAADDVFMVTVREVDGDTASAALNITITDDTPTARNDTDSVPTATFTGETGNVLTGAGTTSGAAGADTPGADGITVTGIALGTASTFAAPGTINGQYGSLSINAQGNYTYTRSPGTSGGVIDVFTYRIADGDGDTSTATLTITIPDAPVTVTSVPTTGPGTVVDEEGLPVRNSEPAGSNEPSAVESTTGTITFVAPDGVASVAINGTTVTGPGQQITTPQGTLTIDAFNPGAGTLTYTFTLGDNTNGDSSQVNLTVTVTDVDGDSDTKPFVITIIDDQPTARADADSVTEDGPTVADGNVITGSGGADLNATDGVADTQGADGASVSAVAFGATSGTVGSPLAGTYGSLTLNTNGSYNYALNNAHPLVQGLDGNDTLTETFSYTLTDGDGDSSATTLTITINGADDVVVINGLDGRGAEEILYEDDLVDGSSPDAAALTQSGTFTVDSQDGLAALTINGTAVFGAGVVYPVTFSTAYGTMSVTGVATTVVGGDVTGATVSYSYTLTDNTLLHTGANDGSLTESLAVVATDTDGSTDTASLDVTIVDDVPTAAPDADSVTEDGPTVADGNVITGSGGGDANGTDGVADTQGADAAAVTAVAFGATAGAVGTALAGSYGALTLNANGSYSYTLNSAHPLVQGLDGNDTLTEIFDYTLTDGDGDPSSTTLTITINGADDVVVINGLDGQGAEEFVYEDDLVDGSSPDAAALTQSGTFTVDSQDGLAALTINGTAVFGVGAVYPVTFSTAYGTMSITGVATTVVGGDVVAATVSYSYTLTDNTLLHTGPNTSALTETFAVIATDTDGSMDTASLDVTIVDDSPTAVLDADTVTEDGPTVADGNVITGIGGADLNATDGALDTQGADGATVTAVAFGVTPGVVGDPLAGAYGSLTLNANGGYSYTLNNAHPLVQGLDGNDTLTEIFFYTLTDGDLDQSVTTLTITINGADDVVVINGLDGRGAEEIVYEDDLADGSSPDAPALTQSGTFTVDSPDGLATLTVNGTPVFGAGVVYPVTFPTAYGTMSITGVATTTDANGDVVAATVSYSYTLTDNTLLHTGANDGSLTENLAVAVTDTDGSTDTASLDVTIVDDVPAATDDTAGQATENVAFTIDALANDEFGADDVDTADPAKVFVASQATYGTVTYDPGTALFTYTPASGAGSATLGDSFTYTIIDRDGDVSTATVNVTLQPDSAPVALDVAAKLDDDGLAAGNGLSNPLGSDENQNDVSETGAGIGNEAIWTGMLGVSSGGADTPLNYSLASAAGSGTVGTETVDYTWNAGTSTLTATVAAAQTRTGTVLFTVKIDNAASGAYTVTLVNPIRHATLDTLAGDDTENNTQVQLTYTVDDADTTPAGGDADTGLITIDFDDDTPSVSATPLAATQAAENVAFTISIVGQYVAGADGVSLATGVSYTQPTQGVVTYDNAGTFTYTPNSGAGSATTADSFTYTVIDADGDKVTRTVNVTLQPDSAPVALDVAAKLDDDGLAAGNGLSNPLGSDENQNDVSETGAGIGNEAIWTGMLGVSSGGADTPLNYSLASAAGSGTVGTETVDYTWNAGTSTLTATVAAAQTRTGTVLFTVKIDNAASGAYTVTLVNPIRHATLDTLAGDDTENNTQVQLTYTVDDADTTPAGGDADTGLITIDFDDDTPSVSATPLAATQAAENVAFTISIVGQYVAGADGVSLATGVSYTQPTQGVVTYDNAGTFTYTPNSGAGSATTADSFTYTVIDADGDKVTRTVNVTLQPDSAPVALDVAAKLDDDGLAAGNGLSNPLGSDENQNDVSETGAGIGNEAIWTGMLGVSSGGADTPLNYSLASAAGSGTVGTETVDYTWNAGTSTLTATVAAAQTRTGTVLFTVKIDNAASGAYTVTLVNPIRHATLDTLAGDDTENNTQVQLTYTVDDADTTPAGGDADTGLITIDFDDDTPSVSATPLAATQAAENVAFTISIVGQYVAGADGVSLATGVSYTQPTQGVVTYDNAGTFTYTPNSGAGSATTADSFTYTVIDADGDKVTRTVNVTLQPDSAPVALDVAAKLDDDGLAAGNGLSNPLGSDENQNDVSETGAGIGNEAIWTGMLGVSSGGADTPLNYSLASAAGSGTVGTETVDYTWNAGTSTLTATVAAAQTRTGTVLFTVKIDNAASGAYTVTLVNPIRHATLDTLAGDDTENNTQVQLTYTVDDADTTPAGGDADTGLITIDFDDDTPSVSATPLAATQAAENVAFTISIVGQYVAGADGVSLATGVSYTQPTQGVVTYDNAGTFTYTPNSGAGSATTADSFTYTVIDADGDKVTRTVNVTLQPDSAPVALDVAAKLDDDGLAAGNGLSNPLGSDENQNDVSETGAGIGNEAIWTGMLGVSSGGADTPLNYSLASAAGSGTVGTETVDYTWNAGTSTLTATVAAAQTRTGTVLFTVKIDNAASGAYTVTLVNPIRHATLDTLAGDDTENNTQVQLTYTVDDADTTPAGGDADTGLITIDFDDDTPTAVDNTNSINEDAVSAGGNVLTNDTIGADAGGTVIAIRTGPEAGAGTSGTVGVALLGTYGSLTVDAAGVYTYALNNALPAVQALGVGETATEQFTYSVRDADGDADTAQLTITINGVNDAPTVQNSAVWMHSDPAQQTASTPTYVNGYPINPVIPTDIDGDNLVVTATGPIPAGVFYFNGASYVALTAGTVLFSTVGGVNFLDDLVYRPTAAVADTQNLTLNMSVFDGTATLTQSVFIHEVQAARLPGQSVQVGDGNSPLTSGNDQDQGFVLTADFAAGLQGNLNIAQVTIVTDFQQQPNAIPIPVGERNPGTFGDGSAGSHREEEVTAELSIGTDRFLIVASDETAGTFEQTWFFNATTGLMEATVGFTNIFLLDAGGIPTATTLAQYLTTNPPAGGDTWTVTYFDDTGGNWQARYVQFQFAFNDAGNPAITVNGDGVPDTVYGGTGNDILNGSAGNDTIIGRGGNDTINGGAGSDTIQGNDGNDTITGGTENDTIDGGAGTDTVTDAAVGDTIINVPPVVLDLDGDGVEFVSSAAGVTFDFEGDGVAEATAWVGGDDGILAFDANGDGKVTSGAEIVFGSGGMTDLQGLAANHDSNHDGVLDAQDADFVNFGVWQDANQSGVNDDGEFHSLSQLGITSIGLSSDGNSFLTADGTVSVQGEGTFVRNGTGFTLADAAFATDRRTAEIAVATAAAGALVTPELAAALAPQATAEQPSAGTLDNGIVDVEAEQIGSKGDAASAKPSDLLQDSAPDHADIATSSHRSDDVAATEDTPSAPDASDDVAAAGTGSEAGADFAASPGALFQFDGGEGLMEALLISASAESEGVQPQDLAPVLETLAEGADEAAVDAIVSHFADADVATASNGAELASSVLLDALDVQLVFAANGAQAPDALDDAAQLAAAAQA